MGLFSFQKWQLGTVFIPDSVGYLVGTNFFGGISYRVGRWRVAVAAMLLVGVSCLLVSPDFRILFIMLTFLDARIPPIFSKNISQ